jgi:hypothetical protein
MRDGHGAGWGWLTFLAFVAFTGVAFAKLGVFHPSSISDIYHRYGASLPGE